MSGNNAQLTNIQENQKNIALNKRLEDFAWGLFLVMIGCIWLIPDKQIPQGTWLIGAGVIMLGLNAARYFKGIKMSGFTITIGVLAIILGLGDFFGVNLPFFPIGLILIGASMLLKPFLEPLLEKK